jgi:hypothetical protein
MEPRFTVWRAHFRIVARTFLYALAPWVALVVLAVMTRRADFTSVPAGAVVVVVLGVVAAIWWLAFSVLSTALVGLFARSRRALMAIEWTTGVAVLPALAGAAIAWWA